MDVNQVTPSMFPVPGIEHTDRTQVVEAYSIQALRNMYEYALAKKYQLMAWSLKVTVQ